MKRPQLFLLHFAGGNCYSFQFMTSLLKDFDVMTLELPGRGKRIGENLVKGFEAAAQDIYRQLTQKIIAPGFLLYGHSMGAYLALRAANMLEKDGKAPGYLFVSGNAGPGIQHDSRARYLLGKEAFKEELKILGGVPKEFLENDEMFDFFEPVLRADFEIAEENGLTNEPPVNCPMFAMMGSEETTNDQITNWNKYTRSGFQHEILEGDHFFIYKHPQRIATIIRDCYRSLAEPAYKFSNITINQNR